MHWTRLGLGILLGMALLLALPVAQAKKPENEDPRGNGRGQYEEPRRADERGYSDRRDAPPAERDRTRERDYANDRPRDQARDRNEGGRRYDERPRAETRERYYERDGNNRDRGESRRPQMSLSDAVHQAERRTGGQVLSAEPRSENGRPVYRVKVLTPNGRVQVLYFDAD